MPLLGDEKIKAQRNSTLGPLSPSHPRLQRFKSRTSGFKYRALSKPVRLFLTKLMNLKGLDDATVSIILKVIPVT